MAPRSWLDLTPRTRIAFAVAFLALQLLLIASVGLRPDRVFAFQMFNASDEIRVELLRRVRAGDAGTRLVHARRGAWRARDAHGEIHEFHWSDRVRDPVLRTLEHRVHAKYGAAAQIFHLKHALVYMAHAISDDDAETLALVARVTLWDNDRPRAPIELEAVRR